MLRIAITGNIASGKSQVEKILSQKYPVYDTDKITHKILDTITDFYGYDVFTNGKIDRKKLGKLVFSNPDIKKKLENIVHPKIKSELEKIFNKHKFDKFIFISVPLLFEAGFETMFDKIILVTTDETKRLERLINRDRLSKEDALNRIQSQMNEQTKIEKSDFVIKNDSDMDNLITQVENIVYILCQ